MGKAIAQGSTPNETGLRKPTKLSKEKEQLRLQHSWFFLGLLKQKWEKQHPAFFGMLETDSDGYVVSHLHEINKREGQSLAGSIPTQHCTGKGSLLYPCAKLARARKSNRGSAKPEVISPDGRQHVFSQLNVAVTTSVGLEHRESKFCLHGE